jgi:hypothetical protein
MTADYQLIFALSLIVYKKRCQDALLVREQIGNTKCSTATKTKEYMFMSDSSDNQ